MAGASSAGWSTPLSADRRLAEGDADRVKVPEAPALTHSPVAALVRVRSPEIAIATLAA
jgi:hypothetical protein